MMWDFHAHSHLHHPCSHSFLKLGPLLKWLHCAFVGIAFMIPTPHKSMFLHLSGVPVVGWL